MPVAPPRPKDLALNALRAFEAAARLGGFAAAAAELGVSPGAVTAHVKALEDRLGAALFRRGARGVELTALGARVLPAFTGAFDALGAAQHLLRAEAAPRAVHVATLPAFAQLWLSPRLPALRAAMPEVTISITAMEAPPNLKRAPYDLGLFPGDQGQVVAEDALFPVCAPALAAQIRQPGDLFAHPVIREDAALFGWDIWLGAQGLTPQGLRPGPTYGDAALCLDAAITGQGLFMAWETIAADALDRCTLAAPLPLKVPSGNAFWFVTTPLSARKPAVRRFRDWLQAEMQASAARW